MGVTREQKGLTLIELMVVVAVLAILTAIAFPSYTEYVYKSRRATAKGDLLELAQFMERNYTEANRYDRDSSGNSIDVNKLPFKVSPQTGDKRYDITLNVAASSFTLTATPFGSQANDDCGTLTLNNLGNKTPTGCW